MTSAINKIAGEIVTASKRRIVSFNVKNFKRFKFFEVKDIGQFNLIVGDNNVGKTSFLEALPPIMRNASNTLLRCCLRME